jgi:F-type H+-transporting ATPase subunit gamma
MSLKDVKAQIRAIGKIHQVTKAMEAVSAVKMRRSQASALEARPYALHAMGMLRRFVARGDATKHPLVVHREHGIKPLLIVITSDRGLAGALNGYVLKAVYNLMKEKGWTKEQVSILAIGKKGYEHFNKRGFTVVDHFERWGEGVSVGDPDALARRVIADYLAKQYDRVMVIYSNFESTFSQKPVVRRLLPISFTALEEVIESIVPERGKFSDLRKAVLHETKHDYLYEPTSGTVLNELLPKLVGVVLYHAVLEMNASEHSARMVAMKSASDRARDLTKELTLKFNKERQSSITAEIGEITSGIEAMR